MDSRYQIVRHLGSGGMAEVFLARQLGPGGFDKEVAIKRIRPELATDPDSVDLFLREARVACRLSHPNIVQVLDLGGEGEQLYLVLEYVDGADLDVLTVQLRKQDRLLSPAAVAWVGAQLCEALTFMFEQRDERGVRLIEAHRDISSANALVSRTGVVKLGDFGVVRLRESKTAFGTVRGKWEYFPPEIVNGVADERGDVYALGVTLYKLAARFHPFYAANGPACFERARTEPPAPIGYLPTRLWAILERALAKDPAARYQRAQDLGDEFEDFLCTCRERMSPRLLAAQLFGGAAWRAPSERKVSMELESEEDTLSTPRPQVAARDELRRFEEIFGPTSELTPSRLPEPLRESTAPRVDEPPLPIADAPDYQELYARFLSMRPAQQHQGISISLSRFREALEAHRRKLQAEHPELQIEFDIVFQDGKPVVRPRGVSAPRRAKG